MNDQLNLGFEISDVEEMSGVDAINSMMEMLGNPDDQYMINQFKKLEKSFNDGKQRRILGGFALGTTRDFEGERAIVANTDYSFLMTKNGRLNSEHNTDLIVGRPIYAGLIPDRGLYAKGILRENSDYPNAKNRNTIESLNKAEEYWELAKSHQNNPSANGPIGFSAEGSKMVSNGVIIRPIVTDIAVSARVMNPHDCTVSILAKSISKTQAQEAINIVKSFGFPVDEIEDAKGYYAHMSNEGASLEFSTNLFNKIRSL